MARQCRLKVVNLGGQNPGNGFWTRKTTHPRRAKSGRQSKILATDFGIGKPLTHSPTGGKIWATDFGTRKSKHWGGKIQGANPGGKIRATDLELGNLNTGGKIWEAKSGQRISKTRKSKHRGQIRVAKSGQRIRNSEIQTPT